MLRPAKRCGRKATLRRRQGCGWKTAKARTQRRCWQVICFLPRGGLANSRPLRNKPASLFGRTICGGDTNAVNRGAVILAVRSRLKKHSDRDGRRCSRTVVDGL